jgi:hypothetical protein
MSESLLLNDVDMRAILKAAPLACQPLNFALC